jgi:uncharacterized protein YjeT (DUF2065 family)
MTDLVVGIGLVLVIEGLAYAVAPALMKSVMAQMQDAPEQTLRTIGVVSIAVGVFVVWLIRG